MDNEKAMLRSSLNQVDRFAAYRIVDSHACFRLRPWLGRWEITVDMARIWLLSQQFDFDGSVLSKAITRTFTHRKTQILAAPTALTPVFADDTQKQTQWRAFLRKTRLTDAPTALPDVILVLASFLLPIAQAIVNGHEFSQSWKALGPWQQ